MRRATPHSSRTSAPRRASAGPSRRPCAPKVFRYRHSIMLYRNATWVFSTWCIIPTADRGAHLEGGYRSRFGTVPTTSSASSSRPKRCTVSCTMPRTRFSLATAQGTAHAQRPPAVMVVSAAECRYPAVHVFMRQQRPIDEGSLKRAKSGSGSRRSRRRQSVR